MPLRAPEPGLEKTPLPLIDILVVGPSDSYIEVPALVDTGSSTSVFPTDLLEAIGVSFQKEKTIEAVVGGGDAIYKIGEPEVIECMYEHHAVAVTAVASDGADMVMLGVNDFLSHFDLTISKRRDGFRLVPSVPGCCNPSNPS